MSLASEFRRSLWLLFACGCFSLFPRFLLLLLSEAGAESLRVDFEKSGSGAQWVVFLTLGSDGGTKRERPQHKAKTKNQNRIPQPFRRLFNKS